MFWVKQAIGIGVWRSGNSWEQHGKVTSKRRCHILALDLLLANYIPLKCKSLFLTPFPLYNLKENFYVRVQAFLTSKIYVLFCKLSLVGICMKIRYEASERSEHIDSINSTLFCSQIIYSIEVHKGDRTAPNIQWTLSSEMRWGK